jgi:VanZ family protein
MLKLKRWIPAFFVMLIIFIFSSTPSKNLPYFGLWDMIVKKSGHMVGYGFLSVAYLYGLNFDPKKSWQAWLLSILYAFSDEFHQSFTTGRQPSLRDVFLFDGLGAVIGLVFIEIWLRIRSKKSTEKSN